LLDGVACGALIGDKGYDADALIEWLRQAGVDVVIPPKDNRAVKRTCDYVLYKERNLIERLFQKMKQFRAIATRYDKLATNFLGAVRLVTAVIQLN
jgi:transposase